MKLLVAILAVLALVGSAMAWEITDTLQYTYVKDGYQQAGSNFILPAFQGATSEASYFDPGYTVDLTAAEKAQMIGYGAYTVPTKTVIVPQTGAYVENTLTSADVSRIIAYPPADLRNADFAAVLTQGGSANVATHSLAVPSIDKGVPEMQGDANAYQNLNLIGGFDKATASFDSEASVGVGNVWATTITKSGNYATVDSEIHGGGEINSANLGESVSSDIVKSWSGTGWDSASYSGGINMWANFDAACDPGCANPIESVVSGTAWTGIFPGVPGSTGYGAPTYWGLPANPTWPFK
jgi:hypothetical protein